MFDNKTKKLEMRVEYLREDLDDLYRIVNMLLGELKLEANKKPADWEIVKTK